MNSNKLKSNFESPDFKKEAGKRFETEAVPEFLPEDREEQFLSRILKRTGDIKLRAEEAVRDGEKRFEEAKKSIGLAEAAAASVEQETGVREKLAALDAKIAELTYAAEEKILHLDPLKSIELLEREARNPMRPNTLRKRYKEMAERRRFKLEEEHKIKKKGEGSFDPKVELERVGLKEEEKQRLNPEERRKLKRERLLEYKRELRWQNEGIAYIGRTIEEQVAENMQTAAGVSWAELMMELESPAETQKLLKKQSAKTVQELMEIVGDKTTIPLILKIIDEGAEAYRLTQRQITFLKQKIKQLIERRFAVRAICAEYQIEHGENWQSELFKEMFNASEVAPETVEVIEAPFALYFRCKDPLDYARVYEQKFYTGKEVTFDDVQAANHSGGVSLSGMPVTKNQKLNNLLKGALTAENNQGGDFNYESLGTLLHEEEHAVQNVFQELYFIESTVDIYALSLEEYKDEKERRETIEMALEKNFRFKREEYEERAKNELLAYYRMCLPSKESAGIDFGLRFLKTTKLHDKETALYDYYADDREYKKQIRDMKMWLTRNLPPVPPDMPPILVEGIAARVFRTEYYKRLEEAAEAIKSLAKDRSKEAVISLLRDRPLGDWPKIVRRLNEGGI